jgi:geranylgeranyl diphosphate synthase type I
MSEFVAARRTTDLDRTGIDAAGDILAGFVSSGKCLRSTFTYLGWLCGAAPNEAALWAASSMELLHVFALLQDDVMDDSAARRGRPAADIQFAQWHRARGLSGSARRFGESAAVLLGDLCLVWAGQMLRESGLDRIRLHQAWPRYDAMRAELAVGQFADLLSDIRDLPPLEAVLEVARRKSGNYTVRRPLEIGAALAGCDESTLSALGRYGASVGEAFQLRDDVLGVFGSPETTGKPNGGDLIERKATSVVVTAYQIADAPTRRELTELMNSDDLDESALDRWRALIFAAGAVEWIENMIGEHVAAALNTLETLEVNASVRAALANMARFCTERAT